MSAPTPAGMLEFRMARPETLPIHHILYLLLIWGVLRTVVFKLDEE